MIWKKITIETNVDATDIVASVLFDNGIIGAEIEDNQNLSSEDLSKMYVDIPKINIDDGKSRVSFYISIGEKKKNNDLIIDNSLVDDSYIPSNDNIFIKEEFESILKKIRNDLEEYRSFMDMGSLDISETLLDDKDFLNKWKENFKSLEIDDITIKPSWDKTETNGISIYIEPGNAFGTGQHSTTKLCVKSLKKIIVNGNVNNVLDIGCGSGILSIISKKLGAKKVYAIDIDENVKLNLFENLKLNNIDNVYCIDDYINDVDNYFIYGFGNVLTDNDFKHKLENKKYDIIIANILAPVIISLIEKCRIQELLNDNGCLVLSGIIKEKEEDVSNSIKNFIKYNRIVTEYEGEWVSISIYV